jgi:hypothetical protein
MRVAEAERVGLKRFRTGRGNDEDWWSKVAYRIIISIFYPESELVVTQTFPDLSPGRGTYLPYFR